MRYPKNVEIWEYAPGRRLAEVVIRIRNERGALAKCTGVISGMDVNILTGFVTAPSSSPIATMSFFADVTDSRDGLVELKRRLEALSVIESVDVAAAEDGFIVDNKHFPVQWAGRKAIILRADALSEMLSRLRSVFGSGAATIIDQMAEAMGRHSAKEMVDDFGRAFAVDHIDELLSAYAALGYAEVSVERRKPREFPVVVHAEHLFECEANAARSVRQRSVFFRAHLRGLISGIFDTEFDVSEAQCVAEGDDVCSFRLAMSESAMPPARSRSSSRNAGSTPRSTF